VGKEQGRSPRQNLLGERALGNIEHIHGSFTNPVGDIISFLAPQHYGNDNAYRRDYPWRRLAYDRTLSCPDLARAINDFLSPGIDFVAEEEFPLQLCA
jgi:hypothetical protein